MTRHPPAKDNFVQSNIDILHTKKAPVSGACIWLMEMNYQPWIESWKFFEALMFKVATEETAAVPT